MVKVAKILNENKKGDEYMSLWIRSQDKLSIDKIDGLIIVERSNGECEFCKGFITYGTYKTKERALEVLDEIQNAILCSSSSLEEMKRLKINFESWYANNTKTGLAIYQMPKE